MAHQICFISHGGGPLPLLEPESHHQMIESLKSIRQQLKHPQAILLISAHWEERLPTLTASASPPLIYDYSGFPQAAYQIEYPCKGQPHLAQQLFETLDEAGIRARLDLQRGFDHGLFVPLKILYPDADIPCVELSLVSSLSASEHIKLGRALAKVDSDDLLIIGSGFSFHNMQVFFRADNSTDLKNEAFEEWLIDTMINPDLPETERKARLENWLTAPYARYCHPREEHLLPLHVCYGIAQKPCKEVYKAEILNKQSSMFLW